MLRYPGFRIVAVGVVTAVVGYFLGTVCTEWVTGTFSYCLQYGYGWSGLIFVCGVALVFLGLVIMVMRGEFSGFAEGRGPNAEPPERPAPMLSSCAVCGQPLAWIQAYGRWYCSKCGVYR